MKLTAPSFVLFFFLCTLGIFTPVFAQDPSAQLDLNSTTKGLLPPRMTTAQRDAISSPAKGLMVYNTTDKSLNVYTGSQWEAVGADTAPVGAVYDAEGLPYLPVRSRITGRIWLDRNLGATRVAQSPTDHLAYGDLYQWGRKADGHQKITWTSGTHGTGEASTSTQADNPNHGQFIAGGHSDWRVNGDDNLWTGEYAPNNPCPFGYRLPTETELMAEVNGWATQDVASSMASVLKFPMAGNRPRNSSISVSSEGGEGFYWTSTTNSTYGRVLKLYVGSSGMATNSRAQRRLRACIKQ